MSFSIRDATLADMECLGGVFRRASLSNEGDRQPLLENPQWLALPDAGVREGRTRAAVDERDTVLGFASYVIVDGVAELEDLFVDPPRMRRRIGEALVLDISERVRALGFGTLEVTANPHAMAFYEHMGFVAGSVVDTEFSPAPRMRRPTR
jgi:GNAT superfamily N-acetyltransferase